VLGGREVKLHARDMTALYVCSRVVEVHIIIVALGTRDAGGGDRATGITYQLTVSATIVFHACRSHVAEIQDGTCSLVGVRGGCKAGSMWRPPKLRVRTTPIFRVYY